MKKWLLTGFIIGIVIFIANAAGSVEVSTVGMHVKIDEVVGFNVDNSSLFFGTIPPGSSSKRDIALSGVDSSRIYLIPTGGISNWVSFSENNFILKKEESINVSVMIKAPDNAGYGEYSGKLMILFWRV